MSAVLLVFLDNSIPFSFYVNEIKIFMKIEMDYDYFIKVSANQKNQEV